MAHVSFCFHMCPDLKRLRASSLRHPFERFIVPDDRNQSSDIACDFAQWTIGTHMVNEREKEALTSLAARARTHAYMCKHACDANAHGTGGLASSTA